MFDYLHDSCYPTNADKNIKRGIRQRAAVFELKEGVLFLKATKRQWIPCRKQQEQIISSCHDDSLGNFACVLDHINIQNQNLLFSRFGMDLIFVQYHI